MANRIFRLVVCVALLVVVLTAVLVVPTLYSAYERRMTQELRQEANCITRALDVIPEDDVYLHSLEHTNRITLIAANGNVLFDSEANEATMANHANRPEVVQALAEGRGESTRLSDTL